MGYTRKEANEIVQKHRKKIVEAIREAEREHAGWGKYNQYETLLLFFDLDTEEIYTIISSKGYSQDVYDNVNDGRVVQVYKFESGRLLDSANEGFLYSDEGMEAKDKYDNDELDEDKYEEYKEKYIGEYIEDYIKNAIDEKSIGIDYLYIEE